MSRIFSVNSFDDDPFSHDPFKSVAKGRRKQLHLRDYENGAGDWETLCRSLMLLRGFWATQGSRKNLIATTIAATEMCLMVNPHDMRNVLNVGVDIGMLDGTVSFPRLVAWCAICHVKGLAWTDCAYLWIDNNMAVMVIKMCFNNFDNLDNQRYTDRDVDRLGVRGGVLFD